MIVWETEEDKKLKKERKNRNKNGGFNGRKQMLQERLQKAKKMNYGEEVERCKNAIQIIEKKEKLNLLSEQIGKAEDDCDGKKVQKLLKEFEQIKESL